MRKIRLIFVICMFGILGTACAVIDDITASIDDFTATIDALTPEGTGTAIGGGGGGGGAGGGGGGGGTTGGGGGGGLGGLFSSGGNNANVVEPTVPPEGAVLRPVSTVVRTPATGSNFIEANGATIDFSNASSGYIMARRLDATARLVVRIDKPGVTRPYDFHLNTNGNWEVFPLARGNGTYTISVLEHVDTSRFASLVSTTVNVNMSNSHLPFLYPNQSVNFNSGSAAVRQAAELAQNAVTDIDVVRNVYHWIITNISYDHSLAASVLDGSTMTHIPNVETTMATRQGICFDYGALMAAMLRSQNIPTRLEIGFVMDIYHAWVSVWTPETDWILAAEFSVNGWELMDPTFTADNNGVSPGIPAASYRVMFMH